MLLVSLLFVTSLVNGVEVIDTTEDAPLEGDIAVEVIDTEDASLEGDRAAIATGRTQHVYDKKNKKYGYKILGYKGDIEPYGGDAGVAGFGHRGVVNVHHAGLDPYHARINPHYEKVPQHYPVEGSHHARGHHYVRPHQIQKEAHHIEGLYNLVEPHHKVGLYHVEEPHHVHVQGPLYHNTGYSLGPHYGKVHHYEVGPHPVEAPHYAIGHHHVKSHHPSVTPHVIGPYHIAVPHNAHIEEPHHVVPEHVAYHEAVGAKM